MGVVDQENPIFTGVHGPSHPLGVDADPVDFLHQLFDQSLLDMIAIETNRYANQKERKQWDDPTTPEEKKCIFRNTFLMGIHRLPHFNDYFSSD
jgi:hypothetical protein